MFIKEGQQVALTASPVVVVVNSNWIVTKDTTNYIQCSDLDEALSIVKAFSGSYSALVWNGEKWLDKYLREELPPLIS